MWSRTRVARTASSPYLSKEARVRTQTFSSWGGTSRKEKSGRTASDNHFGRPVYTRHAWRSRSRHKHANFQLIGSVSGANVVAPPLPELADGCWDETRDKTRVSGRYAKLRCYASLRMLPEPPDATVPLSCVLTSESDSAPAGLAYGCWNETPDATRASGRYPSPRTLHESPDATRASGRDCPVG